MGLACRWVKVFDAVTSLALGGQLGMEALHADGSAILDSDMRHVRGLMWRHSFVSPWQEKDAVFIDNNRIAHARQAFQGPRSILVAWSEDRLY